MPKTNTKKEAEDLNEVNETEELIDEMDQREEEKEKKKKRLTARIILFILFLFFVVVAILLWLFMQQPAQGVIIKTQDIPVSEVPSIGTVYVKNKYYEFSYLSTYEDITKRKPLGQDELIKTELFERGKSSKLLIVNVRKPTSKIISEVPDLLMRRLDPKRYKEEKIKLSDNIPAILFTKKEDSFEKVLFVVRGDKLYTMAFSSTAVAPDNQKYIEDFEKYLDSLKILL